MSNTTVRSDRQQIKWEHSGDVLKVRGVLLKVGEFTCLEGKTTKFVKDSLKDLIDSLEGNIPLKVTHFSDKIVGYATKFALNDSGDKILFEGYVFDQDAIDKIMNHGYDGVSAELYVEVGEDNVVEGGVLTGIAFTPTPAVEGARVEEAKVVALSKGGEKMISEVANVADERKEFFDKIRKKLQGKGLDKETIDKVFAVLEEVIKVPYPYPAPAQMSEPNIEAVRAEYEQKLEEYEAKVRELEQKLSVYANELLEIKKGEFKAIVEELKKLGLSNPEKIVEDIEDIDKKIKVLRSLKEDLATKEKKEEAVEMKEEKKRSALEKVAEELGLSVEEVKEIFGGEIE